MPKRTCKVDGCFEPSYVASTCRTHRPRCSAAGCQYPERARGLCANHYEHWRRHPDEVEIRPLRSLEERFAEKVERGTSPESCWLWTGSLTFKGYGMIGAGPGQGNRSVHRLAYEWVHGPVPLGLQVTHTCGVRSSVRPDHLLAMAPLDVVRRGARGSALCAKGHSLSGSNVRIARHNGQRVCRECARDYSRTRGRLLRRGAHQIRFTKAQLEQRAWYFGRRCWVCGADMECWDHVKPISKGGWHCLSNLRPACRSCNQSKGARWPYLPSAEPSR